MQVEGGLHVLDQSFISKPPFLPPHPPTANIHTGRGNTAVEILSSKSLGLNHYKALALRIQIRLRRL
jgi:hypothetical protein